MTAGERQQGRWVDDERRQGSRVGGSTDGIGTVRETEHWEWQPCAFSTVLPTAVPRLSSDICSDSQAGAEGICTCLAIGGRAPWRPIPNTMQREYEREKTKELGRK